MKGEFTSEFSLEKYEYIFESINCFVTVSYILVKTLFLFVRNTNIQGSRENLQGERERYEE